MKKQTINPKELFNSTDFGFSQIVTCSPGKMVFISGQVAWNENREIIGKGDLKIQVQQSIENLKIALKYANGTLENVVMLRIYVVNYSDEAGEIVGEALRKNFGAKNPPASTWLDVTPPHPALVGAPPAQALSVTTKPHSL